MRKPLNRNDKKKRKCDAFYEQAREKAEWPKDDMCDPPTDPKSAINVLIENLLGKGWYVSMPENHEQTITAAVYDILEKYADEPAESAAIWRGIEVAIIIIATLVNAALFLARLF